MVSNMANLGTVFNTDFPAGFTWVVDNAIKSSSGSTSEEETSPVRTFASVVDSAINSDGAEEEFRLVTRTEIVTTSTDNVSLQVENEIVMYIFGQSCSANTIKKSFQDFSCSDHTAEPSLLNVVTVNGKPIPNFVIKKAKKLAGPIQPGNYWYDFRGGFWGVMGGPCLGIIPPFIEEFNHPLPYNCSAGNTDVYVNGRELHQNDLDLLVGRGLPSDRDRSYIIEISGRVLDEHTGQELDSLGKLAPVVEKMKHGFGMSVPLFQPQCHETRSKYKGVKSFLANTINKSFQDFFRFSQTGYVTVNGKHMSNPVINRAEKLAGTIQPGNYWGGFWGAMGGPCLGIIPPFMEEFNLPMPYKCSGGNTGIYVNGRELHQKDLDLLARRGLPKDRDRSYIIEISGRVLNEDTGEVLKGLGKLAPTIEKSKRGFGMKVGRAVT
ncbi:hypothetical protein VNO80_29519 [Phaseolus coccineus]|uniref:Uncharacterized protein n=1 Tax=Phaseolus coccineus TaxID=3886 RepID=A0AAN9QEZ3_PHACN